MTKEKMEKAERSRLLGQGGRYGAGPSGGTAINGDITGIYGHNAHNAHNAHNVGNNSVTNGNYVGGGAYGYGGVSGTNAGSGNYGRGSGGSGSASGGWSKYSSQGCYGLVRHIRVDKWSKEVGV
jgi:hypothetical protein